MTFDGETLQPRYRLEVGIPGSSHALDIALRVGVPEESARMRADAAIRRALPHAW
ncbi:MAG: hypothetical protein HC933_16425 [Pleurocapsa sp. SU_196_0]|nr:hypothetical protein [Pleurocapsa sp. SU_196_0]